MEGSCAMTEASHLFSVARRLAAGVEFLVGMTGAGGSALVLGAGELVLAGEEDFGEAAAELLLVGAGALRSSGAGDDSVVTETLGSVAREDEVSEAGASSGAGVLASS